MVETIYDIEPFKPMPNPHNSEVYEEPEIGNVQRFLHHLVLSHIEDDAHINTVTEPERQTHMPTVPEIFDVLRFEWLVEVHWCLNAINVTERYSK